MRRANDKFSRRFAAVERALAARGVSLDGATLDAMEGAWEAAKAAEKPSG
jgi:ATP diphosphatase